MKTPQTLGHRLYFFVPYNISDVQKGIQSGHAGLKYLLKFCRYNPEHELWDFLENDGTWIILNGGTTNKNPSTKGSLDLIEHELYGMGIDFTPFYEPDLNDAMSALCFFVDERVYNYEDYPIGMVRNIMKKILK